MAKCVFLAMTASEYQENPDFSGKIAWMACHFSQSGSGLSNLPASLPPDSLVILNDSAPIHGHDPQRIAHQLSQTVESMSCRGVLLDMERKDCPDTAALAAMLTKELPCPVIVSALYAQALSCPVFLPPVPPDISLEAYLAPWKGREIWLEAALTGETVTLTEQGAQTAPVFTVPAKEQGFQDNTLHCHYQITLTSTSACFTLWRTGEDLEKLLEEAHRLGVTSVGLYQELGRG